MAIKKQNIVNSKVTNFTNSLVRITTICENMNPSDEHPEYPHSLAIFSTIISIPDTGITLPFDTILGRNRELTDVFDTHGSFAGSTKGNEQLIDKTQSITLADDYVYLAREASNVSNSKSIIFNMLAANGFTNTTYGRDYKETNLWKVIGTNGNIKRARDAYSDLNHMWLLWEDGKLEIPQASNNDGSVLYQENTRIIAYNSSTLCIMLEIMVELSREYNQGYRYVYCSPGNLTWNEGDDYNKLSTDVQFLCDVRSINNFFIEDVCKNESRYAVKTKLKLDSIKFNTQKELNIYFSTNKPTGSPSPTTFDVIDSDNEYLRVYCEDEAKGNVYFILHKECTGQISNQSGATTGYRWVPVPVAVNADGTHNVMIKNDGSELKELDHSTIDFVKTYCFPIYNFDFEESKFVPYGQNIKVVSRCGTSGPRILSFVPENKE